MPARCVICGGDCKLVCAGVIEYGPLGHRNGTRPFPTGMQEAVTGTCLPPYRTAGSIECACSNAFRKLAGACAPETPNLPSMMKNGTPVIPAC